MSSSSPPSSEAPLADKQGSRWRRALTGLRQTLGLSADTPLSPQDVATLENKLLAIDVGVKLSEQWAKEAEAKGIDALRERFTGLLQQAQASLVIAASPRPHVVLMVGVNGAGKTTTVGKLAARYHQQGLKVMVVAADTFRSAASEQLELLCQRVGVDIITGAPGEDPAALCYRACTAAADYDLLLIDTAGRLQNRQDLMAQLSKIIRIVRKQCGDEAPHTRLLVLEASTGMNALSQYTTFGQYVDLSGVIVTKLDGSAKGGMLLRLVDTHRAKVYGVGLGEGMEDLVDLDPDAMVSAMLE
ncbi:MAG: signal recognition particle-docking protein FtsY [Alphaproteobacteria bacterium]|nr:signal recognition particle-docking protein FtsY [Alphaproteobacteria bacterium]